MYQSEHIRNVKASRVQVDEIWAFCQSKQKNVAPGNQGILGHGDVWTYTAIDADSKLMISYMVGKRDADYALAFMTDVYSRLANRVQLTTDGHGAYLNAVPDAFGTDVDFAMLVKHNGVGTPTEQQRYSPAKLIDAEKRPITGNPDKRHISTSYVERSNLTMRMGMRRFTRLTNGFLKKVDNLEHAVSLHFMHYNYARIHKTLRVTPAMEAGLTDHVWTLEEIAALAQ
ncbi:DDE-type integrase/transposase/recombinase [Caenimonas koreensis]|uniref:DDE-type integrase/transposase/recombinase n=1 Tax=Caenimonas koreensis TaxID=367474 RepID=UPI00188E491C|nr:DDE-type integrase/transposase/recombinase [Caenimonas koreensis]